jgi:hypothetical protein
MSGQPNMPGFWVFDVDLVEAVEVVAVPAPIAPSIVVNAGQNFNLDVTLTLDGSASANGEELWYDPGVREGAQILHYALNLETGIVTTLPYHVPAGAPQLQSGVGYKVTTGPYTTGLAADLDIGTYQITTNIRLTTARLDDQEAAFKTSYLMVIPALP